MSLAAGTRLGPYEIISPLGSGGMGEVYRARDPRMGRDVAIKTSAETFSDRFEREVHAVAALNHPHISHIYDVGQNYLVMELVDGVTLADRINQGAIPLDEALRIARQIGDALEAAHEKGIVHRDLKPANIKITLDGSVKLLDFGLAKMADVVAVGGSPSESPTMVMGGTIAGEIMGTAAYMAPEQARGKPVDKRADIWAFGVVLYEMVTGQRLFDGETISDTIAEVLTKEPRWQDAPPEVQRLLRSCLEKDQRHRLRDVGDAWRLLENAPVTAVPTSRLPWAVTGLLVMALALALWAPWRSPIKPIEHLRVPLDFDLGPEASLPETIGPAVVLSPDGKRVVFVSQGEDGTPRLFTRQLDQPKARRLPGTEGAYAPFFSPDGQWVGFFAPGKLKKARIDGGEPITLCDAPAGRGASWGEDGNIIAALETQTSLSQIPAQEGGNVIALTKLNVEVGENTHRWPHILPGGNAVLFNTTMAAGNYDEARIAVFSLKDHSTRILQGLAGMNPRYLRSGHLVYATKGILYAVPFDSERLELRGTPIQLEAPSSEPNIGSVQVDFSRDGTFVYRTGGGAGLRTIQWLDGDGKTTSLGLEPALYMTPRLSPDGRYVAYAISQGPATDIWVYDLQRGNKTRLTKNINALNPVWSADSRFVIFRAVGGLFWRRADGAGEVQTLMASKGLLRLPSSFSPRNPAQLLFTDQLVEGGGEGQIVTIESASGQLRAGTPQPFLRTSAPLGFPSLSPDGLWVAFADAKNGPYEVYVRAVPDNGERVPISTSGGWLPIWSPNGRELFYRTEDQRIMVTPYTVRNGEFSPGKPRPWFNGRLSNAGLTRNLDLDRDGKRFVVVMPSETSQPRERQSHVMLELNYFDEIRRRFAQQAR